MSQFLKISPREYQISIANSALAKGNTLVILPTGLGKTLIAFLVIEKKLQEGRVAFLAPTKPLVTQHYKTFLENTTFSAEDAALITGEISPKKRKALWEKRIIFSTPQTLKNDIIKEKTNANFSLCVIDEAHRAIGNYAYTFIAEQVVKAGGKILGLTASPGGNKERIQKIVDALFIENIEIRTSSDPDILPYVKPLKVEYVKVKLNEQFLKVKKLLEELIKENAKKLLDYGFSVPLRSKKALVELHKKIMATSSGVKYPALSYYSTIFNLSHMLELFETQGLATFLSYVEKLNKKEDSKAKRRIFSDPKFLEIIKITKSLKEHPKMEALIKIISAKEKNEKFLIFTQYRDQVKAIVSTLKNQGFLVERFVGKKEGVTAEEQKRTIERFYRGEFDILVATSIGEEGLDIPSVDTVIFFEPVPSEIRTIQRRGRAGRLKTGKVIFLITEGTRDEAFFYSSKRKEEKMHRIVRFMKKSRLPDSSFSDSLNSDSSKSNSSTSDSSNLDFGKKALQETSKIGEKENKPKEENKLKEKKIFIQKKITDF